MILIERFIRFEVTGFIGCLVISLYKIINKHVNN